MRRFLSIIDRLLKPEETGKSLNPNIYPNNQWYREHTERNFDLVILGDADKIPRLQIPSGIKAFDWSLSGQNLQWDFNVIKHFFSVLKPEGLVVFPLTDSFVADIYKKVDERRYYIPMMPYFFTQSKVKMTFIRICKHIPILARFPFKNIFNTLVGGGQNLHKSGNVNI